MNRRQLLQAALALPATWVAAERPHCPVLRLYGRQAQFDGAAAMDGLKISSQWKGTGAATWTVNVAQGDDHEVALCYASQSEGSRYEVVCGNSKLTGTTQRTRGLYEQEWNYERTPLRGTLKFAPGPNRVTLRLTDPKPGEAMRVRSVELTPAAAKPLIDAERERAVRLRASTDWLVKSGYGLMFHWTSESEPRHGPKKPYADAVEGFPVKAFIETVQETGAGHVLFTVNHALPHCPAPIRSWEKYHPGLTTQRDLLGELADGLDRAGIPLLLYINSPRFGMMKRVNPSEFLPGVTEDKFVDMHREALTEIGQRYGKKLSGYWFDSWIYSFEQYPDVRQDLVFRACKEGNPDRVTAFNFWIMPVCTDWQEYWAGEMGVTGKPATSRYIEFGAGKGFQHHSLLYLDAPWVHGKPETEMEPPIFAEDRLIDYTRACMEHQGVVTVNLGIYQDGAIGPEARRIMNRVRKALRG